MEWPLLPRPLDTMATLLVTGGAGFIGSNLVRRILSTTTDDVVVVDKLTYASNPRLLAELFANP